MPRWPGLASLPFMTGSSRVKNNWLRCEYFIDFGCESSTFGPILAREGPLSRGDPEGGARLAFPRLRSQRRLGRFGNRSPGTTTRMRGARVRSPEEMLETDASEPNRQIARRSAERRARLRKVGVAPRQRDQSMRRSALRRPSSGGKRRFQDPGAKRAAATRKAVLMDGADRKASGRADLPGHFGRTKPTLDSLEGTTACAPAAPAQCSRAGQSATRCPASLGQHKFFCCKALGRVVPLSRGYGFGGVNLAVMGRGAS